MLESVWFLEVSRVSTGVGLRSGDGTCVYSGMLGSTDLPALLQDHENKFYTKEALKTST